MARFKHLTIGLLLGSGLMFAALRYHVVRYDDGFLLVPRTAQPWLMSAFADVRHWDAVRWTEQSDVAAALVKEGYSDLIIKTSTEAILNDVRQLVPLPAAANEKRGPEIPLPIQFLPGDNGAAPLPPSSSSPPPPRDKPSVAEITGIEVIQESLPAASSDRNSIPTNPFPIAASPLPVAISASASTAMAPQSEPEGGDWLNELFDDEPAAAPPATVRERSAGEWVDEMFQQMQPPETARPNAAANYSATPQRRDLREIGFQVLNILSAPSPNETPPAARASIRQSDQEQRRRSLMEVKAF